MSRPRPGRSAALVTDRHFSLYRDSDPAPRKEQVLAILDAAPCGTPHAQRIIDALVQLDALIREGQLDLYMTPESASVWMEMLERLDAMSEVHGREKMVAIYEASAAAATTAKGTLH